MFFLSQYTCVNSGSVHNKLRDKSWCNGVLLWSHFISHCHQTSYVSVCLTGNKQWRTLTQVHRYIQYAHLQGHRMRCTQTQMLCKLTWSLYVYLKSVIMNFSYYSWWSLLRIISQTTSNSIRFLSVSLVL